MLIELQGWLSAPNPPKSPVGLDSPLCEPKRLFTATQGNGHNACIGRMLYAMVSKAYISTQAGGEDEVPQDSGLPKPALEPRPKSQRHYEVGYLSLNTTMKESPALSVKRGPGMLRI